VLPINRRDAVIKVSREEKNNYYHSWADVNRYVCSIIEQMQDANWEPDYIVGVARGGLVPAVMLSHHFQVPLHNIHISFRDNVGIPTSVVQLPSREGKKVIIVDDINDSGKTLDYINSIEYFKCCDVKYAVLLDKTSSEFQEVDYFAKVVFDNNEWHVFPWEELFLTLGSR
jgi:xanthine phosphoribosyltransferase